MIDTHCHLDSPVFDPDRQQVLERSRQAGVGQWVVPGIRGEDFPRIAGILQPGLVAAYGLHPMLEHPADGVARLAAWLEEYPAVAVGEIGLDDTLPASTRPDQLPLFEAQMHLAQARRLPVLLHVRKAHDQVLAILRRLRFPHGGIVHAFGGSLQQAQQYGAMGFKLGIGGVVTWTRASRVRQVAATVDEGLLVLETDAPDLPVEGLADRRNEPCHVRWIAETLASLRHTTLEHIQEVTDRNARQLFPILKSPCSECGEENRTEYALCEMSSKK